MQGEHKEGSLLEHLEELRTVIVRMLLFVTFAYPFVFYFAEAMLEVCLQHLCPAQMTLKYFSPVEPLMVKLRFSFYASIFFMAPFLLREIWSFVAPALFKRERKITGRLLFCSWFLFVAGGIFSIWVIFPLVMNFSLGFSTYYLEAAIGISQFVSLLMMLILGFGIMFQFPAAVFIVVATGIISVAKLKTYRATVFVIILAVSALLTPPDIFSQVLMGLPTYILFELGLLAASFAATSRETHADKEQKTE
jgi:sec-independent protein translocase protein TatC